MSKIAVVTDSNSGVTQSQANELGLFVVPMPFMINDQDFYEDINLTQEQFYTKLGEDAAVSTSQPTPDSLMTLWDKVLQDYDQIIYIPMSSGLSGSCQSAYMIAQEEYEGKVFVVDNQRISVTQRQSALDALEMAKAGLSAEEIVKNLMDNKFESSIYIMLDTLYYLKKGGRITPAAAALGTLLRLKPVLQIQGEKLDAFAKARTTNQGKNIMINAIKADIENRFGGMEAKDFYIACAYTKDLEAATAWKKEVEEAFPGFDIHMDPLSLSVACHIGPGALAVTVTKKLHF
ncbi:EDD domain protein, DegV family [Butyrivibrio proteoclasticus]|uniref:EDD domain protein, DegV family n=1 Tax=Butyrivibrio proteoclasticus TaxID=43305 RepID=A0A1I5QMG5_9FIRM|nr:DegV family protein [Butyrivibrio proteoclasticus]SFP47484.1 EDD domain protein, DegV family [Butyrivibrio proteoclasticus]